MKTIDELAREVLAGKWGSGETRKKKLTKAGYNYDKVQARVNQYVAAKNALIEKGNAWARKIAADNRYHYNMWEQNDPQSHKCPICSKLKYEDNPDDFGWNCIGYSIAPWHHGMGLPCKCCCYWITGPGGTGDKLLTVKTDAEALKLARQYTGLDDVMVLRNKNGIPKSEWQPGDICLKFSGEVFQHAFYYPGGKTILDSTRIYNDKSKWTKTVIANQIKERSWDNYSAKVIIRWTGYPDLKDEYTGKLPTLTIKKTTQQVIDDACLFAKWIAGDDSFHYGYTNKHGSTDSSKWNPNAHHNGCYFCNTNTDKGGRSKKGIVDFEKTYCCNPFVHAAFAHGGCVPSMLTKCQAGGSYTKKSYEASKLFKNLGKPKFSELKKGDILYYEKKTGSHYALYLGGGKLAEASAGDDNKRGSEKWKKSIRVRTIKGWGSFQGAFRFVGSVDAEMPIRHGEISDRVALLQEYLVYKGFKIAVDRYFGDDTFKALKKQQKKLGLEDDGIAGPLTLNAMKAR